MEKLHYIKLSDADLQIAGQSDFIWTGIKYEILLHNLLFVLALFFKFLILTCLFRKISISQETSLCRFLTESLST